MIKVLIVDDEKDVVDALKRNIDGKGDIQVIGTACNGRQAVDQYCKLHPEVILMDSQMPELDGIEATKQIKRLSQFVKILIFTNFSDEDKISKAIENECDGFILKGIESDELISIIYSVFKGRSVYDEPAAKIHKRHLAQKFSEDAKQVERQKELGKLTKREIDIVRLITTGKKDCEIAEELFLSEGYVRNQLVTIREKLGLRNSRELARWGGENGL